jgi:hypothetical protein
MPLLRMPCPSRGETQEFSDTCKSVIVETKRRLNGRPTVITSRKELQRGMLLLLLFHGCGSVGQYGISDPFMAFEAFHGHVDP